MIDRRSFLGAATGVAAIVATAAASDAASVPGGTALVERAAQFDLHRFESIVSQPKEYKVVWDLTTIGGAFNNVKNCLNGYHFGFGLGAAKTHMVLALHGPANAANFTDAMWAKYRLGEWLKIDDPATGKPATRNIWLRSNSNGSKNPQDEKSIYQDKSIEGLQRRGCTFFT
jgi:hypothetical protein